VIQAHLDEPCEHVRRPEGRLLARCACGKTYRRHVMPIRGKTLFCAECGVALVWTRRRKEGKRRGPTRAGPAPCPRGP
jgi:hypothetical protein